MKVLGVITARGGSKGIPGKNIRPLGGHPLIAYTIAAARRSRLLSDCLVSTDDEAIAAVARRHGAEVPFLRPAELASDTAKTLPVLLHALEWAEREKGVKYDYVLTLQPTSPFRTAEDIDAIVALAETDRPKSAVSVIRIDEANPTKWKTLEGGRLHDYFSDYPEVEGVPRQQLPVAYKRNCALYLTRTDVLHEGSLYGGETAAYVMPLERSVDINVPMDFDFAEFLIASGRVESPSVEAGQDL